MNCTRRIILTVHESIADVDRSISKSAYTLLEEMETKLDQVSDFLANTDEIAKLGNEIKQTVAEGKSVEATLKIDIGNGNTLKTSLEKDINDVNTILPDLKDNVSKATELEPKLTQAIKDGGTLKSDLSEKITEGNNTSTSLTQANTTATATKTSLDESIKKASDLIENNKDIAGLPTTVNQLGNPSLLINGDFQVWQRGISFTNISGYTVDRWRIGSDVADSVQVTKSDNGVKIKALKVSEFINFLQIIEDDTMRSVLGKKVTITFKFKEATDKVSQIWGAGLNSEKTTVYHANKTFEGVTSDTFIATMELKEGLTKNEFGIQIKPTAENQELEILWAKLEIGEKATSFIPRLYGEELALCQRYYQTHVASGVANTPRVLGINSRYPTTMRVNPTIILSNVSIHEHGVGEVGAGSDVDGYSALTDRVDYIGTNTKDTFTQGKTYNINGLCLDAEIY